MRPLRNLQSRTFLFRLVDDDTALPHFSAARIDRFNISNSQFLRRVCYSDYLP
jgi:hypothetical protein